MIPAPPPVILPTLPPVLAGMQQVQVQQVQAQLMQQPTSAGGVGAQMSSLFPSLLLPIPTMTTPTTAAMTPTPTPTRADKGHPHVSAAPAVPLSLVPPLLVATPASAAAAAARAAAQLTMTVRALGSNTDGGYDGLMVPPPALSPASLALPLVGSLVHTVARIGALFTYDEMCNRKTD